MSEEAEILRCWDQNAGAWSEAVRTGAIESRKVTDRAILQAVGKGDGRELLDLGCGEGSLSRRLTDAGWKVVGVDAARALLEQAREAGDESFVEATYSQVKEKFARRSFDCIVANFSLLGQESTRDAIDSAGVLLKPGGKLWIQTLYPESAPSGWRTETWSSLGLECHPSPWFARSLEEWRSLFRGDMWSLSERVTVENEKRFSLILSAVRL